MTSEQLSKFYLAYLDCLNRQDWDRLDQFVAPEVVHNDLRLGLTGYQQMLVRDFLAIPDLRFTAELLVAEPPHIAARLLFDCHPAGELFGLPVNGRRVRFAEQVIYRIEQGLIRQVWSLIDTAAIQAQI